MSEWSLSRILGGLHDEIERRLATARQAFAHPGTKGDASERVWRELLQTYLPRRYQAETAHVVDSKGAFSEQIDVVVFDRQYSPFILNFEGQLIIPAESVYAAFEAKQSINAGQVDYAQKKVASVRRLHRTSLPIPHAGGVYPAKELTPILGGLLTFESDWSPALGEPLVAALAAGAGEFQLDLGCIAAHGIFGRLAEGDYALTPEGKPATAFLFELIARLQDAATVPMIDVRRTLSGWLRRLCRSRARSSPVALPRSHVCGGPRMPNRAAPRGVGLCLSSLGGPPISGRLPQVPSFGIKDARYL